MTMPRYPNITVPMVGEDGNAFAILGRVKRALKQGGASDSELLLFMDEALWGDYDHLLSTVTRWVETS